MLAVRKAEVLARNFYRLCRDNPGLGVRVAGEEWDGLSDAELAEAISLLFANPRLRYNSAANTWEYKS